MSEPTKLLQCPNCQFDYPTRLVQPITIVSGGKTHTPLMCPICALHAINMIHGMARTRFAPGSQAQRNLEEAYTHLGTQEHKL